MKHLIFTLLVFQLFSLHAQVDSTSNSVSTDLEKTYVLDMVWQGRDSKRFKTDGYPSFLMINNGLVTLYSRSRNQQFAYESPYLELTSQTIDGEDKINFIGENNYKIPSRPSFEIVESSDKDVLIYIYHTLGGGEGTYFKAHVASQDEANKLLEYLRTL